MRAWVLHGIDDLRWEETARPVLKEGEVLLAVRAAGICGSDIPRIYRDGAYSFPLIPGHEFSGVVEEAGGEAGQEWLGKRVGVFPLIPCKSCAPCRRGQYEMCRSYSYLGSRRDGGFAEYVAVPAENLIALPKEVSFEAAAMLEPMAVALHALRRTEMGEGDTVAVCGLGTIGLLLLMALLASGRDGEAVSGKLFAIGNKEAQKQRALELGLPEECYCDSGTQNVRDWLMERTEGLGVSVFYECVGKNETFSQAVELAAPGGRVVLVGNPASDMGLEKSVYWKILRNQLHITGTWNSSFTHEEKDDWSCAVRGIAGGVLQPERLITHKMPLEKLENGLQIMRDKTEDYVKIMCCYSRAIDRS